VFEEQHLILLRESNCVGDPRHESVSLHARGHLGEPNPCRPNDRIYVQGGAADTARDDGEAADQHGGGLERLQSARKIGERSRDARLLGLAQGFQRVRSFRQQSRARRSSRALEAPPSTGQPCTLSSSAIRSSAASRFAFTSRARLRCSRRSRSSTRAHRADQRATCSLEPITRPY
jgi:hypothetical protein